MFSLSTAVKERNRAGILACFNFEGVDDATRRTAETAVREICYWPTTHVFSSSRSGEGPLRMNREGKVWELNGEWEYQVHILVKKEQPSKGFVFPAGLVKTGKSPRQAVLLLVEKPR